MAHRFLKLHQLRRPRVKDLKQFKYLLILDFEATCEFEKKITPQEIIELPCLALSTETWEPKDVFHEYVKPRVNPILTSYCTDLTGIIQEMVDSSQPFPEVFESFQHWLKDGDYLKDGAFLTCGDWDLKVVLPEECANNGIQLPHYFHKWIDLKKSFFDVTGNYPKSLKDMLRLLKLPIHGRLHSGIQDVHNMTRIIQLLGLQKNATFNITSTLESQIDNLKRKK